MHHRTFVFDYIGSSPSPSPSPSTQEPPIKASDLHSGLDLDLGLGLGFGPRLGFTSAGKHKNDGEIKETDLDATSSPSVKTGVKRGYAEAKVKSNEIFPENVRQESVKSDDDLPSKGQVVGWPPVRYYRRHALTKPSEMFVKVNMDGVAVGRKVDLNAYSSYERLLQALEEMFQPTAAQMPFEGRENDPKHALTFNDSEFVLTYEDKDGDWMMVGDVPWSMFISSVRRLRITRGSETNSSAPTLSNKRGFHP